MEQLIINFDKRYELIFGLLYTVAKKNNKDFPWIINQPSSHEAKFYEMAKDHISREFENYILTNGLDFYDKCCYIASSLSNTYDVTLNEEIIKIKETNKAFDSQKLSTFLKEFVSNSNYEEYFLSCLQENKSIISKLEEALNVKNTSFPEIFKKFYGYRIADMRIIPAYFLRGSFGLSLEGTITFVAGMYHYKDNKFSPRIAKTLFHEFSHPYVNPLGNKYFENIDLNRIIEEAKANGLNKAYYKKEIIINEYVVRAIETKFSIDYFGPEEYERSINYQKSQGFIYIEDILELINRKENHTTFEEFYQTEIVPYFIELEEKLTKEKKNML